MKKILVMAALMVASVATFAQNEVGRWTVQPKFGMNIASLTKAEGSDARIGIAAGAELEYGGTDIVGLSFGAVYSMQGCKYDDGTMKLDYLNVPILANIYMAPGLAVKVGLQPGFNLNCSYKEKGVEVDGDAKTMDLSIPVGLSYQINNFVIDGRYNWGVTKIAKESDCKNSVFQITLGYKFTL